VQHFTELTMPDPIDRLALALLPILFGSAKAPPSGRLRPRLLGRPHPRRRLGRWGMGRVIRRSSWLSSHPVRLRLLQCSLAAPGSLSASDSDATQPMIRTVKPVRAAFRLTEHEYDHLNRYAAQRGLTFSDLCRTALQQFEAQQPDQPKH